MAIKYYEVTEIETITRTGIVIIDHDDKSCEYNRDPIEKFNDNRMINNEYRELLNDCAVYDGDYSAKEISAPYDYNDRDYWPMTEDDNAVWLKDDSGSQAIGKKNR